MDTLKPCPFCGSDHIKTYRGMTSQNDGWWYVICQDCRGSGPADLGESGAIEQWNTRHSDNALLADALFELENAGSAPDLCERIRDVLRTGDNPNIERGIMDELPW